MKSQDVLKRIQEVLIENCENPSESMIKEGQAMIEIGKALKGMSLSEARATINAVTHLEDVRKPS